MAECPCGSKKPFKACCGPYVEGVRSAPTAEALMRSRYTAYALRNMAYLRNTSEMGLRGGFDEAAAVRWTISITWLGLTVLEVDGGQGDDETGEVTYIARYLMGKEEKHIAERAVFHRLGTKWLYVGPRR